MKQNNKIGESTDSNLKITVVTVCFNAAESIEDTILSVVDQLYDNVEYIVIDGSSTDGTVDIIKKYAEGGSEASKHRHRITKWISEPDEGIYDAMNKGIALSTGDYINFMNAGDTFADVDILSRTPQYMQPNIAVFYGSTYLKKNNKIIRLSSPKPFFNKKKGIMTAGFCHQSTFVSSKFIKKFEFDKKYKIAADFNLLKKIYEKNGTFFELPFPVAIYDVTGISSVNQKQLLQELLSICNVKSNSFHYYKYLIIHQIKRCLKQILYRSRV